jgi:hypothetical protein
MKESTVEKHNAYVVPSAKMAREKAQAILHGSSKSNETQKGGQATRLSKAALVTTNY